MFGDLVCQKNFGKQHRLGHGNNQYRTIVTRIAKVISLEVQRSEWFLGAKIFPL